MKLLKSIAFLLCSVLEVQVQAKELLSLPLANKVTLEPANCLLMSSVCSVTTGSKQKFILNFGTNNAVLSQKSVVVRESADTIHILEGTILVKSNEKTTIKCEFGKIISEKGEVLVSREEGKVFVRATAQPVVIIPRGSNEELILEPGFENWLYKVTTNGQAQTGVPLVWDYEPLLKTWARLFDGNLNGFRKKTESLKEVWANAVENASFRHKNYAQRLLASAEADRQHRARVKKKEDEERRQIRELMIQRNYLDLY